MFYIEKNDKPNWIVKKMKLIKVEENTIYVPDIKNYKEKEIEKIASKTIKAINKYSTSRQVILSKEMQEEEKYVNYLNTYGLEIEDGKWLFEMLVPQVIEYILQKIKIEKEMIAIMINDVSFVELEIIKELSKKYKNVSVVTNHFEKFEKITQELEDEGIILTISNNKKKSVSKANIIINIDFPSELINQYKINEEAVIISIKQNIKIKSKRFNGLNIKSYEIDYRNDIKETKEFDHKYYLRDIYSGTLYKKQNITEIKRKISNDKVIIKKLILNNGEL